jgi:hypothetical protein
LFTDLGFDGPMDFWKMSIAERAQWLDDGLHLTPKVGHMCKFLSVWMCVCVYARACVRPHV